MMRAALHERWGSPLEIADIARPEPAAGEIRVAVRTTSVNPIDMHTGANSGYEQSMRLPCIPGWDVAGVVDAVGYGVTRYTVGDRVYGMPWFPYPGGTYAEYLTVPAYQLAPMPRSASFVEAGCLPMAALTAWQMLAAVGARAGHHILISGTSGGVGHLAVQLAIARGATVTALARPDHHATLHDLGAHICVDYTDLDAVTAIGKVDAVIDLVGHEFGASLFDRVTPGGRSPWRRPGRSRSTRSSRRSGVSARCRVWWNPIRRHSRQSRNWSIRVRFASWSAQNSISTTPAMPNDGSPSGTASENLRLWCTHRSTYER